MNELLQMALAYQAAGLSVIPLGRDKRPYWERLPQVPDRRRPGRTKGVWQPFREIPAGEVQIRAWFGDGQANVGLVGGRVSGGLVVLDFDHEAAAIFPAWLERVGGVAVSLPTSVTSKGFHVYLRLVEPIGNRTLAWSGDGRKRIETRGEGGYITAPPSRHASGHVYRWLWGEATAVPVLSAAAFKSILAAAAYFDQRPKKKQASRPTNGTAVLPWRGDALLRLQRYAHAALHREVVALGQMPSGGRNDCLNRAAFCLGRYVGAGLLPQAMVIAHLRQACQRNGLIADDGQQAFWNTLVSGLDAGMRQAVDPQQLLSRLDEGR
ncbi:MAG: bifunctional DNA primase/polymerase [Chloroflexi bacterium]|nr:bifunctional DNA primase/polymerase [Chloroflexota bacterium]